MDERIIELINKEIDGLNTPSSSRELEAYLNSHPDAKKLFVELQRASDALKHVEAVEPPSYLKTHIMNAVRAASQEQNPRESRIDKLIELLKSRPARRYSLVFASGLCVGILFFVVANPWQKEGGGESALSGSLVASNEVSSLPLLDAVDLGAEEINGAVKSYKSEQGIAVEITLTSPQEVNIELISDPAELMFEKISRSNGADGEINLTDGRITFSNVRVCRSVVFYVAVAHPQRSLEARVYTKAGIVRSVSIRAQ
jgi:hypothetical protein